MEPENITDDLDRMRRVCLEVAEDPKACPLARVKAAEIIVKIKELQGPPAVEKDTIADGFERQLKGAGYGT